MKRFDPDLVAVKRGLRELYDRYPKAFEVVAAELMRDDWRNQLPPIVKGRDGSVKKVTDEALAHLLVGYLSRPAGMTQEQFLQGIRMDYGGHYYFGTWRGRGTLLHYLRKAQTLFKRNPVFRASIPARLHGRAKGKKAT